MIIAAYAIAILNGQKTVHDVLCSVLRGYEQTQEPSMTDHSNRYGGLGRGSRLWGVADDRSWLALGLLDKCTIGYYYCIISGVRPTAQQTCVPSIRYYRCRAIDVQIIFWNLRRVSSEKNGQHKNLKFCIRVMTMYAFPARLGNRGYNNPHEDGVTCTLVFA